MSTILDVAKEAKVSIATVSRLLNNEGVVSPDTAKRVHDAIEKLAYEPNILARNFRKNESRVILIISPNVTNPYYARILSGIGDVFTELGYSTLIYNTADDSQREKEALEMLKKRRADGAILMANNLGSAGLLEYASQYPLVQCCEYESGVDIPHVSIDNYLATNEAMDYLIKLGHRKIAIISSENDYLSTSLRMKGYKDSLQKNQIAINPEFIAYASRDYSIKSGQAQAAQLLRLQDRPTAIFCIADTLALGAIATAKEFGLRIPEDITVIGFDDVDYTTMFHPHITTIAQPCYELGRQSAHLLFSKISLVKDIPNEIKLDHELIIRESSGSPTL